MEATVLRDLLTAGVVARGIKSNYNTLATNQYMEKILMDIYCKFITRILNREFSIQADKKVFETLQYWINKFFLTRIFQTRDTEDNIEKLSKEHIKFMDELALEEIVNKYKDANPMNISELFELLKTASPRMKALTVGSFLSDWVVYYHAPSTLAIDNVEYLIFMILALLSGNNTIVNISASDIVKEAKNIKSFRGELLKLI